MKPTITTGFDQERAFILESRELGAVMAVLVNALDPQALVIGGGLGTNSTMFARLADVIRPLLVPGPLRSEETMTIRGASLYADQRRREATHARP